MLLLTLLVIGSFIISGINISDAIRNTKETDQILTYSYTFSTPIITKKSDFSNIYQISIPGLQKTNDYLYPRLPVKPLTILIPYKMDIKDITIQMVDKVSLAKDLNIELGGMVIPLSKQQNKDNLNYSLQQQSIQQTQTTCKSTMKTYFLRGYQILHINLYPVEFDQKTNQINFYKHINVTITFKEGAVRNTYRSSEYDQAIVQQYIDNPSILNTYPLNTNQDMNNEQYDYVIITNENMKHAQTSYTFQDLITQKESKGVTATIITIEEIKNNPDFSVDGTWGDNNPANPFYQYPINGNKDIFDDIQARIRNFIRYAYSNWNTKYVLLAGDSDTNNPLDIIVPHRGLFADEQGLPLNNATAYEVDDIPSDVYYACLDGNFNYDADEHFGDAPKFNILDDSIDEADLYAEVFVGRACVDSEEEVSNFVKKAITYDELFYDDYFKKIVFLGEFLGSQFYFNWGGDYKDLIEPLIPDQYDLIKLYHKDDSWNSDTYWSLLNENPPLIFNHDGHGSPTSAMGLNCPVIEEISNEKYYFIYSHTCLAGSFDNCWPPDTYYPIDCVAEYFTVETDHGAIGVVMNARYGLGSQSSPDSPSGAYDESFFEAIFSKDIRQLGAANHYSKEQNIWQINENGMRWAYYETNLFGDPEISIKKPTPQIQVEATITNPINQGCLYINDGEPILLSFLNKPVIFGGITLQASVETTPKKMVDFVEFIIDGNTVHNDYDEPYNFYWENAFTGNHEIQVVAHASYGFTDKETCLVYFLW